MAVRSRQTEKLFDPKTVEIRGHRGTKSGRTELIAFRGSEAVKKRLDELSTRDGMHRGDILARALDLYEAATRKK